MGRNASSIALRSFAFTYAANALTMKSLKLRELPEATKVFARSYRGAGSRKVVWTFAGERPAARLRVLEARFLIVTSYTISRRESNRRRQMALDSAPEIFSRREHAAAEQLFAHATANLLRPVHPAHFAEPHKLPRAVVGRHAQ